MTISREAVIWGYRYFLERDPESEEVIAAHTKHSDEKAFTTQLLNSDEFRLKIGITDSPKNLFAKNQSPRAVPYRKPHLSTSAIKVLVIGNCQAKGLARCIQGFTGDVIATSLHSTPKTLEQLQNGQFDHFLAARDLILLHPNHLLRTSIERRNPSVTSKIRPVPRIGFAAFHPDITYVNTKEGNIIAGGQMGQYQSSIAYYGWRHGLSLEETYALFRDEVFDHLGFYNYWDTAKESLLLEGIKAQLPLEMLFERWSRLGTWMYSMNHPSIHVLADIAREVLKREGITTLPHAEHYIEDNLRASVVWPVYPEIAKKLGVEGWYGFKLPDAICPKKHLMFISLKDFLHSSYNLFSKFNKNELTCPRLDTQPYQELESFLNKRRTYNTINPYTDLADYQFWRRAFHQQTINAVDPVVSPSSDFRLKHNQKIATAGSCFAQHISRTIQQAGFEHYVTEQAPELDPAVARHRQYGVFSARYGNIYSTRQLVQLFDRAYGTVTPRDKYWMRNDGRFIDPFRPRIEPEGFDSPEAVELDRAKHLTAVRDLFAHLDFFIFTLGLTEAWRNTIDGMVFPLAPGVVATHTSSDPYEFVNFNVTDVVADLQNFCQRLATVNPHARLILTVSPVPLIATYENRHILVSTTASKSILRAAVETICATHSMCEYFPAYEIVTGSYTRGQYFEDDLRSVTPKGVNHVMRLFMRHYSMEQDYGAINVFHQPAAKLTNNFSAAVMAEQASVNDVICDEEVIDGA